MLREKTSAEYFSDHPESEMEFLLKVGFIICFCFNSSQATYEDHGLSPSTHLPKCMNVTMAREHYNSEDKTINSKIGGFDIGEISNVAFGPNNETVSFCFPLSPQLLTCKLQTFPPGHYKVNQHDFRLQDKHFSAELGDYFIGQNSTAYACTDVILADRSIPRCHFITLEKGMYAELGNDSLYINSMKTLLKRATYTIDSEGKVNACYPLTIRTLNCKNSFFTFHSRNYNRLSQMKIAYKMHNNAEYGPAEYYSLTGSDLRVCVDSSPAIEFIFYRVYQALGQLSLVCLCFTLIYQLMTRKSNLHDKCLACFSVTLIAYYIELNFPKLENCHAFFLFHYVLSMSAKTWLTLTTYDIWKSFTSMKAYPNRRLFKNNNKFIYYSIVGWGSPFLWYIFVLITNHFDDIFAYEYTIDSPNCYFKKLWAFFAFYFGPTLILNGFNIFFFISTTRAIHREARNAKAARNKGRKQVITVCIKLFFVMGVSLITEGIMLSLQHYIYFHHFYISDAFKSTQGIAIFVVVMCKREAFRAIRNNCARLKLKWDVLTTNCRLFNRKTQSIPIYLVEENHLNLRSRQAACQLRTYILHDDAEGDTFNTNNEFMTKHEVMESRL